MFYRGRRLRNKKVPRNLIKENRLSVEQLISQYLWLQEIILKKRYLH
mgnify:FL=1